MGTLGFFQMEMWPAGITHKTQGTGEKWPEGMYLEVQTIHIK